MKYLFLDVDKSTATIGGSKGVEQLSGFPPIVVTQGSQQIQKIIDAMFTFTEVKVKHPVLSDEIVSIDVQPKPLMKEHGIQGLVIDSLSHAFNQDKRILEKRNKTGALEMQDWGTLERWWNKLSECIKHMPIWIIGTCHLKYDKDENSGIFYYAPQLAGATRDNLTQYFDSVYYTKTSKDGKKLYTWQTYADASKFEKDRTDIAPIINQDFTIPFQRYKAIGVPPHIIIIGESGTGKTKSLLTIPKEI